MFGLSWTQILVIVIVGVFLLGPERIPVAIQWLSTSLRKARTMAQGAQAQLNSELGPEIAEMRRQIAELQSLKELQELRDLRDLHPKNLISKGLLGDGGKAAAAGGGISGLLGIDKDLLSAPKLHEAKPDEIKPDEIKPVSAGGPAEAIAAAANSIPEPDSMAKSASDWSKPDPEPTWVDEPVADELPLPAGDPGPAPVSMDKPTDDEPAPGSIDHQMADQLPVSAADLLPTVPSWGGQPPIARTQNPPAVNADSARPGDPLPLPTG